MARISQKCWSLILGTILGDAWLSDNVKRERKNSYMGICHSIKQEAYLMHKFDILKEVGAKTVSLKIVDKNKHTERYSKEFVTQSLPIFTKLRKMLYKNGKKRTPEKFLNKLTDASIAYWFMDDGSLVWHKRKRKQGMIYSTCEFYLATNGFLDEDVYTIQKWFFSRYSVLSCKRFHKPSNSYILVFNRHEYTKLLKHIEQHFIPEMKYKVDMSKLGILVNCNAPNPSS